LEKVKVFRALIQRRKTGLAGHFVDCVGSSWHFPFLLAFLLNGTHAEHQTVVDLPHVPNLVADLLLLRLELRLVQKHHLAFQLRYRKGFVHHQLLELCGLRRLWTALAAPLLYQ